MATDPGLRRLALGTLLAAFPGPSAPAWALDLLGDGLAGHTLFGTNVTDIEQVATLTARLRAARPDAVIAIDEEGGDVTRLFHRTGSPYPGNAALGTVDDPELTRQVYAAIGSDLRAAGVTLDLAPVVDVNTTDDNPVIGTRSFGADPDLVSRHAAAAVDGLQSAGVAACAKHFPGHGATVTDSHLELPVVDAPLSTLLARDLPPFTAALSARAIMTAHIRVPALTGLLPATFSRAVLTGLLRERIEYAGVIITDALEMRGATAAAGGIGRAAVLALSAGADLLCLGARVSPEMIAAVVAEIAGAVASGSLPLARLEEAVDRTSTLSTWTANHTPAASSAAASSAISPSTAGPSAVGPNEALGLAAARRAIRVEGSPADLADPAVVRLESGRTVAEGVVPWGLPAHPSDRLVAAGSTSAADLLGWAAGRPIVVVGRNTHRFAEVRELLEALAREAPVGVVEMGWPSRAWRPAGIRAFIATYGASEVSGWAAAEVLGLGRKRLGTAGTGR